MKSETKPVGQDTIYVCQTCSSKEKEFSIKGRITKICQKCGGWSVKSTLCDTLDYVNKTSNTNYFEIYDED